MRAPFNFFYKTYKKPPLWGVEYIIAPEAGLEPATLSLTGIRSTIELLRNDLCYIPIILKNKGFFNPSTSIGKNIEY